MHALLFAGKYATPSEIEKMDWASLKYWSAYVEQIGKHNNPGK